MTSTPVSKSKFNEIKKITAVNHVLRDGM
jgi:hypothetical protein